MNPKRLKATLLGTAALAVVAMVSPAMGRTYAFTLGTFSGGAYCDGLTFSDSNGGVGWSGNHTGCTDNDFAGGFTATIKVTGNFIDINTTDQKNLPGAFETFLLDTKAKEWFLLSNLGGGFELLNGGVLIKGAPDVSKGGHARASSFKNPKAIARPVF